MKSVWVVLGGWNYEGWDDPVGIYTSKRTAEKARGLAYKGYDMTQVLRVKLDELPVRPVLPHETQ